MNAMTILIIDDEPIVRLGLGEQLRAAGYTCQECEDLAAARVRLDGPRPGAILLDLQFPDGSGLDLLPDLQRRWPATPVIMMTAHGSVRNAVSAMQRGAVNYLQKPLDTEELKVVLVKALKTSSLQRQAADRLDRESSRSDFGAIVAKSTGMRKVIEQARAVAESPASTVLLLGESGVGKGIIARAIHYCSTRRDAPFLTVTCSAIPDNLLEAEMFGHERGAFTDAKSRRRGVFESAEGGTVLLDEIGDMPPPLQAKLLGVLEDRQFHRVGSTNTLRMNLRIIAATHRDLRDHVAKGLFREDLYYRLRVVPIVIPPLRERVADILPLANGFIRRFNSEFVRDVIRLDGNAADRLKAHSWRGNVRELRNVIEHAMLFADSDTLKGENLLLEPGYQPQGNPGRPAADPFSLPVDGVRLEKVEEKLVRQALDRAGGNKSKAAKLLGISRDQIRYRLEKMQVADEERRAAES